MGNPRRKRTREVCPYDGTEVLDGAPCPECEREIAEHLRDCWRCSGDYADRRKWDEEH